MASKPVAFVLAGLGVTKSHSRPRTSNDNPYSEAHVKTLKYRPDFPDRFDTIEQARAFCRTFFTWYNTAHRHSGIAWHTPHSTLHTTFTTDTPTPSTPSTPSAPRSFTAAYQRHPEPAALPTAAWINPPSRDQQEH
jgi:putative transposase